MSTAPRPSSKPKKGRQNSHRQMSFAAAELGPTAILSPFWLTTCCCLASAGSWPGDLQNLITAFHIYRASSSFASYLSNLGPVNLQTIGLLGPKKAGAGTPFAARRRMWQPPDCQNPHHREPPRHSASISLTRPTGPIVLQTIVLEWAIFDGSDDAVLVFHPKDSG